MSIQPLKQLTIEHLRGSVVPFSLPFEKGKKLTIVYGENGTGKTTICDALEFLSKGRIGSLEDRGLGQKPDRYWPSVGKGPADVSVSLDAGAASCTAKVHKGSVVVVPADQKPKVEVLRRSQILRLLEAQPSKRYEEISRFIDITGIETSEAALKKLISNLSSNRDTAVAVVYANLTSIKQFWETAGKPGKGPIDWAEVEVARDFSNLEADAKNLSRLRAAYQRFQDYPQKYEKTTADLKKAQDGDHVAANQLEVALSAASAGAGELVAILEAASPYLDKHPHIENCPLCESAEKVADLHNNVAQRLKQFTALQVAQKAVKDSAKDVQRIEGQIHALQADLTSDSEKFEDIRRETVFPDEVELPGREAPAKLDEIEQWLNETSHLPESWQKCETAWVEQSKFVETLAKALSTYRNNVVTQKELDVLLPKLQQAHEILIQERQTFTDGVLKTISSEVGRLYEAVHPGEGLNKISIELEEGKRASLEVGASFAGQDKAPPQAYFSQSHLDTLGLCVFLALALLDDPENTVLVLDDVLASVDEPHVDRLIEMLYAEADKFRHCIITTHYRPWKHKLRWGWLKNGQCQFVELTKWSLDGGLQHIRSVPDIERLRTLLEELPPDPQLVCAKAGVILEATLTFLVELYECHLPKRASGRYTIGELLPAIDKKLRQELKVVVTAGSDAMGNKTTVTVELAPILEKLAQIAQIRNVFGAHFNELSFELLEDDASEFGTQVLTLAEAIADQENGWPRKEKNGSYWANSNETRCLYPLKRPA